MPDINTAAFGKWLAGIEILDGTQRDRAVRKLAVTEAADPIARPDHALDDPAPDSEVAPVPARPVAKPIDAAPGENLLAKVGRIGTPLAGWHHQDRWQDQARALIAGESVAHAAMRCKVAYTTAFGWRHRFLSARTLDQPPRRSGSVAADARFILESFKRTRPDLRHAACTRGGAAARRGLSAERRPLIVARNRTGATIGGVLPRLDAASITAILGPVITRPAGLCCDGGKAFARRARVTFHGWRRTIEAISTASTPGAWIMGAAGLGPYQQNSQ